ncbi:MAG: hypothetical protein DRI48_06125, partial [Chloroflexi bacterium]
MGRKAKDVTAYTDKRGALYFIVHLEPSGFVIVPGDDLVEPIVGFAPDGEYDPSPANPLGALVSSDLPGRMAAVRDMQAEARQKGQPMLLEGRLLKRQGKWAILMGGDRKVEAGIPVVSDVRVAPLVESRWSQSTICDTTPVNCYNYYTPQNYVCGCVATAMAQLMRFHQYPTVGVGRDSFAIQVDGVPESRRLRGGDGLGGPYDWGNMALVPDCSTTETERQAIGALCHDAGVAVHMMYSSSGSGAYSSDIPIALEDVFGYSNAVGGYNADANIGAGLNGMINPNLDAGLPVLLGIDGPFGGHSIVSDGYGYDLSTLYHHLNLGWAGSSDAWYNLPDIDADPGFDSVHGCTYNVFKTGSGEIISGRVLTSGATPIEGATVTAEENGGPATCTDQTNAQGIYALTNLPSNTEYTVSATKAGRTFFPEIVSTGISTDYEDVSGNVWGVDFWDGIAHLEITTSSLPSGTAGLPYSATLEATGGLLPYAWSMMPTEALSANQTPAGGVAKGWNGDEEAWAYTLPFSFPFGDSTYTSVYVCSNGYLDFANSVPDCMNSTEELKSNVRIAPLWSDLFTYEIYIDESAPHQVTIRWEGDEYWDYDLVNFEVVLYEDGGCEFHYGAGNTSIGADWTGPPTVGISYGDGASYVLSAHDGQAELTNAQTVQFMPLQAGLSLNADTGVLSGTPTVGGARTWRFFLRDNRGVRVQKDLELTIALTVGFDAATSSGYESLSPVALPVSISGQSMSAVTVNYAVTGGTATSPNDFTLTAGTLTFNPGEMTNNISATILDDAISEGDETIVVTLSDPNNAILGANTVHTYTIKDNEIVSDEDAVSVPEGATTTFHVKLCAQPTGDVHVVVARQSGDADISVLSGDSLTFTTANWDSYQTVTLAAAEDGDTTDGTATIRCSATDWTSKDVSATEDDNDGSFTVTSPNDGEKWEQGTGQNITWD